MASRTPSIPPQHLSRFPHVELVLNTTPPLNLPEVGVRIRSALPGCAILSLYDPLAHMHTHRLYYEYWCACESVRTAAEDMRRFLGTLREACTRAMHGWYDSTGVDARAELRPTLAAKRCSFGRHLEEEFLQALQHPAGDRIDPLLALAEAFPFFALPRDAAATELVQRDLPKEAARLFAPVLTRYPTCHHTLTKAAELQILADNVSQAAALLERAQALMPNSSRIGALRRDIDSTATTGRRRDAIEAQWRQRHVRPTPRPRKTRLHIITPVWGEPYIDTFMKVTLASLLARGSLPLAAQDHEITYTLYTRKDDIALLQGYEQYKTLTDIIPVSICCIEDVLEQQKRVNHKYGLMSLLQTDGLQRSLHSGAHSFLLLGDFILSDHFLTNALTILDQGVNTIFFQSLRTCEERMLQRLRDGLASQGRIELSGAALCALGRELIHPAYRKHFAPGQVMRTPNSFYRFNTAGDIIQHSFAQNAMFVAPCDENVEIHMTLDVDLGYISADAGLGNYHLVRDNLDMLFFELTQEQAEANTHFPGIADRKAYAYWQYRHMDPLNRYLGAFSTLFTTSGERPPFCETQLDLSCTISRLLA